MSAPTASTLLHSARSLLIGDGLRARALRGSAFNVMRFAAMNLLRLASNLILTRLLFPEAFGIMALIQVVMSGVAMFSDFGIRDTIIQDERGEDPVLLDTAWTVQIARGVLIWLAICALALPAAHFYEVPELAAMLPVAGLAAVFQGLTTTRLHLASRNLHLGRVVGLDVAASVIGIASTVALAFVWPTVWALVFGMLIGPLFSGLASHAVFPGERNRLRFESDAAGRLFRMGRYIFLATVAAFFVNQGDRAVLGKFVSLSDIAIYNIGFFLATVPYLFGLSMVAAVIQPLYSRRPPQASPENRHAINRARILVTAVLFFGAALLAVISVPLVTFLYDPRYEAAGPVMTLIALASLPGLILMSYMKLPLSEGHSGRFAVLMISAAMVQIAFLIVAASNYGLVGVALTPAAANLAIYPLVVLIIARYGGVDLRHDAGFLVLGLAITAVVLWLHWPSVAPLLAVF